MSNTIELFVRITDHFVSPFSNWKRKYREPCNSKRKQILRKIQTEELNEMV